VYGMHSVPSISGNSPGGLSGKGVVKKEQLELICQQSKSVMDVALSDEMPSLHDMDLCSQGDCLSSVDMN